jgi:hypothetical protein
MQLRRATLVVGGNNRHFERELAVVQDVAGATTGSFYVFDFVSRVFEVQRHFGIRGTSAVTSAILSLLVFEGIVTCPPDPLGR